MEGKEEKWKERREVSDKIINTWDGLRDVLDLDVLSFQGEILSFEDIDE